ncbi:MAG: tetratricopeptide repeat protein [Bacteroidota bacterium]|nr:tetratricopeptide repeat protein [Bacteroidota bacterium]
MKTSKFYYFTISLLVIFISCNSSDNKPQQVTTAANPIENLKNEIRQYPDSSMLIQNLIEAYRDSGSYDSALTLTDEQIRKDSGNAYLWDIKATLYFENGDTSNAINSLEQAINIYPLSEYLVALGTIYAETKNEKALKIADELLKSDKDKSAKDAFFIKGLYFNYINQPQKAIPYLDSCLQLNYSYMYAYREKAIAFYNLAKYNKALVVLKRAVTLQNNYDEGYYWMGKCYEKLNQRKDAIESYQNALLYDKNFVEAKEALNKIQNKK